jgi:hypothetical protein
MSVLTANDCALWLPQATGIPSGLLTDAIEQAEALAGDYCHRVFATASFTEYHDVLAGMESIGLRNPPVSSVVLTDNARGTAPTTVLAANYYAETDTGIVTLLYGASPGTSNLKVVYTGGYSAATLPAGLKRALLQLVGWLIDSRGDAGSSSSSMDGMSITREGMVGNVPASIASQLNPYVRRGAG